MAVIKRYDRKGTCPYCGADGCIDRFYVSPSGIRPKDFGLILAYNEQWCLVCERASEPKLTK